MAARQRELSALGEFRRDFWRHVAGKYPGEVKPDHAGSNVFHQVDEANLRVAQYVARDHVGVYLVKSNIREPGRLAQVEPYLERLRKALNGEPMSEYGATALQADTQDRANWDRMADWLHDRRILYERVLRETAVRWTEALGGGYLLAPCDPDFARQMALADDVMRDDREVLRALAK